jgi:hypothetical protein
MKNAQGSCRDGFRHSCCSASPCPGMAAWLGQPRASTVWFELKRLQHLSKGQSGVWCTRGDAARQEQNASEDPLRTRASALRGLFIVLAVAMIMIFMQYIRPLHF